MANQALDGIRVIDFGEGISAPYCARLFADYGADVIKIETPGRGDPSRHWGPFPGDAPHLEKSGSFHFLNTNKRSICADPDTPEGRERILEQVARADVLIENRVPRRMREWGLDWSSLESLNPQLVMISITPFGQSGPYADWRAHDLNAYHLSGASSRYCGRAGEMPLEHGTFSADFFGAVAGAAWGLAATLGRERAGGGQQLDVSCAEVIAATFVGGQNIGGYAQDGRYDKRTGVGMPLGAPATIVPCKDGHVWLLALESGQWNGLAHVMGDPDWMQLDLFQDMFTRAENADFIYSMVQEWSMQHSKMEIMEECQAAGCPITAVFTIEEAAEHPHLAARGYRIELEHAVLGRVPLLGPPFKLSRTPGGPRTAAPTLGEHDAEVDAESSTRSRVAPASRDPDARARLPLEGIRVANFGWVWAGPVVGQTLSFLGAEVYKIESRSRIDMTRTLPPFAEGVRDPSRSLSNHACWAGNGSITLNLKHEEARQLALQLIEQCDVVIENFGPGVMSQFGLAYEDLRRVKPDIVMFSMPAAGLYGPLEGVRTYGLSLTSLTGLDSLTGYVGGPPIPVENAFSDPFNGVFGAFAVLTALAHRERTGEGQQIDFSQQEAVMQMVGPAFMDWALNARVAGPLGNRHPLGAMAPHGVFRCAGDDRWISLAVADDSQWRALRAAMGDPDWAGDDEWATLAGRLRQIDRLHEEIARWTLAFDDRELAEELQAAGVAATPVLDVADLLNDPHYRARRTFVEVEHPLGFRETIYGAYVKLSRTEPRVRPGPAIGQDNDHVFRDLLGLSEARYRELQQKKIID